MNTTTNSLIADNESIVSVESKYGRPIRFWDDGFGPLWAYREVFGVRGVVRAMSWEDAYSCVVDEIMGDADMSDPDNAPDAHGNLPEGLEYRGGTPANDGLDSPVAQYDLNGQATNELTPELLATLGLRIVVSNDDTDETRTIGEQK